VVRRAALVRAGLLFATGALVVLLPTAVSHFRSYQLTLVGIYFIAIVGLNVVTGYSGQISLGQGAFMAIGAYATAILNVNYGVGIYWTIPCAAVIAGVIGLAFGFPALRLSGVYLALATFALATSIVLVAKRFDHLTGGTPGKVLPLPSSPTRHLAPQVWLYYLTWAIAIALLVAVWLPLRGRIGRSLRAVRDGPIAATAFGVSLPRFKTLAFAISALYAGVAGSLYAIVIAFVNPDTFPVSLSILLLTGAVLGGLGSLTGMIFGALFIEFVPVWAQNLNQSSPTVLYGVILIVVLYALPGGAGGVIDSLGQASRRASARLAARRASRGAA
jgi:branched-chain amino acid transport system permease protein